MFSKFILLLLLTFPSNVAHRANNLRDKDGWSQLNGMLQRHIVANFRDGMTMAEKVRAMQMIQGDVSAMSVDAQGNSLLVSDQRDQFFERLRGNAIYVRNGSLFASPPALPEDDLSSMRRGRLWALARECGVPKRALPALRAPAAAPPISIRLANERLWPSNSGRFWVRRGAGVEMRLGPKQRAWV